MIRKIIALVLFSSFWTPCFAVQTPDYNRVAHPRCTCSCQGKIIYKNVNVTPENLNSWAVEAVTQSFTYGFGNYKVALEKASQYFTKNGWDAFVDELLSSKNLDVVTSQKLIVSVTVSQPPTIKKIKSSNGLNSWMIEIPIMAQYANSTITINKPLFVTLRVSQTSQYDEIQGLGIEQFIVEPRMEN